MDYHVDAKNKVLGRLATDISLILQGKKSATFERNRVSADKVYVTNYDSIIVTGKKATDKVYYKHTGYIGGLKELTAAKLLGGRFPERVVEKAVERMIPRGPLGRAQMRALHLYNGTDHPHAGNQPEVLDVASLNRKNKVGA